MPRPFRFSLQKVLDYRGQLEDQAKLALAKAQQAFRDQKTRRQGIETRLTEHLDSMATAKEQSAADIWLARNFTLRLKEDLAKARIDEQRLAQDVQKRRAELVDKAKERKLLEKLKETQAARHEKDENHKEQAGFDEMATLRYQAPAL